MGHFVELTAADGHRFAAYRAEPSGKPKGGIVVIQEIFGVNSHIRAVTDGYAAAGYLAIAPAVYDRAQRNYETGYSPADIEAGRTVMQALNWDNTLADVNAAVAAATVAGKVGIVGYCYGGTVAWLAAARSSGIAASVPYYGGGIPNFADEKPRCPVMFQFGEQDKSPTPEAARAVVAKHPGVVAHFYNAGHGFNCDQRGSYDAAASALAKERSLEFFGRFVG